MKDLSNYLLAEQLMANYDIYISVIKKKGLGYDCVVRKTDQNGDYPVLVQKSDHIWSYSEALNWGINESLKYIKHQL